MGGVREGEGLDKMDKVDSREWWHHVVGGSGIARI